MKYVLALIAFSALAYAGGGALLHADITQNVNGLRTHLGDFPIRWLHVEPSTQYHGYYVVRWEEMSGTQHMLQYDTPDVAIKIFMGP